METMAQKNSADIFPVHSVWDRRKLRRSLKRRMPTGRDFPETLQGVLDVIVLEGNGGPSSMGAASSEVLVRLGKEKWGEGENLSEGMMCLFIRFCQELLVSERQGVDLFYEFATLEKALKGMKKIDIHPRLGVIEKLA